MDTFYILTNEKKDKGLHVTRMVQSYIEKSGKKSILAQTDEEGYVIPGTVPCEADCAIVIGGDGTLIQAIRGIRGYHLPVLGINMGTLGYLAEVEVTDIANDLNKLFEESYTLEYRMMMQGSVNDGAPETAVNDIVLTRDGALRIMHFNLYVNGELMNRYEADGVIISTPTGSTGYNLSAGGPIVEPTAQLFIITPICSHALNTSSVVLSAEDVIEIEVGEGRGGSVSHALVSFDGTECSPLITGDKVRIEKTQETAGLVKLGKESFMATLRRKMKGK